MEFLLPVARSGRSHYYRAEVDKSITKREQLVAAATTLFEERGYRTVSIQDITEAADMSIGSFYNHFKSKEALYTDIVYRLEREGIDRTERIVARYHSPLNKIRAVYRFVTLGVRHNRILRGMLAGDRNYLSPEIRRHLSEGNDIRKHVERLVTEIIREGTMRNTFRTGSYRNASAMVSSLFEAILANLDSEHLADIVEDLLTLIERGLKRRLRLRRRPERLDRRMLRGLDEDDEELGDLLGDEE